MTAKELKELGCDERSVRVGGKKRLKNKRILGAET